MSLPRASLATAYGALLLCLWAPAASAKVTTTFDNQILAIVGDDADDQVAVTCAADATVKVNGENPKGGPVACSRVVEIDATTGAGNDVVDYSGVTDAFGEARFPGFGTGIGAAAVMGLGNDRFIPSATAFNLFDGEDGKDRASGGDRRDLLSGGPGNDVLRGGDGRDTLFGNAGADRIFGEKGADTISGHAGNDFLSGGAGADAIGGGSGRDRLLGGPGADKLSGGTGRDILRGGPGRDREIQDPPKGK